MSFNCQLSDINYRAKIIRLPEPFPHPNAQKLACVNVDGNIVITGIDCKPNSLYLYFPLESILNKEYLSWSNSFEDKNLNSDPTKRGFFHPSGRVRAIALRSQKSEGYVLPVEDLQMWFQSIGKPFEITDNDVGTEFDTIHDILVCWKYINKQQIAANQKLERQFKKKVKKESRLVDNQFRLHFDTSPLAKNIHILKPTDIITLTKKLHGCNYVVGKVLCKKPLKLYEKVLKFLRVNIVDSYYDVVYSSRSVVKNKFADKPSNHFYDHDIWGLATKKLENCLPDGVSLIGEIVGFTPSNSPIQKDYDYGCNPGEQDVYIFRATYTNPSGQVFEFSWPQVKTFCNKYGIKHVPELYHGYAKDLFNIPTEEHWNQMFLEKLTEKYLEKRCSICKNDVPDEGFVIRIGDGDFQAFKHKSWLFKQRETKELDSGVTNIEDEQVVMET